MIKKISLFTLVLTLMACGSQKKIVKEHETVPEVKPKTENVVITTINKNYIQDSTVTFNSRLSFSKDGESQPKASLSLKMRNNKLIWGSASLLIPLGRAIITPSGAKGYAKFPSKLYFDSDYALIEKKIGLKGLSYEQIESILTGRPIFTINDTDYTMTQTTTGYTFVYNKNKDLLTQKSKTELTQNYEFDKQFNLVKQSFVRPEDGTKVDIIYSDFETILGKSYPRMMDITANEGKHIIKVNLEHKSIEVNLPLQVPFELPKESDGYKKVNL